VIKLALCLAALAFPCVPQPAQAMHAPSTARESIAAQRRARALELERQGPTVRAPKPRAYRRAAGP
jgi:hypothetical protein